MADIYFISDTHFHHANTFLKFKQPDGSPMRPFTSVEEMNECMVERWNEVVRPQDKIYHLGDVVMGHQQQSGEGLLRILGRLNGHKRLILGNHDQLRTQDYLAYFDALYSSRRLEHILFTHIPVHPDSIGGKLLGNVHGHIHNNTHRTPRALPCPPYLNICVELTDYRPLSLGEIKERLRP